jgi:hypothetical protein
MDFKNVDWNKAVQNTLADYEKSKSNSTNEKKEVDLRKYFTLSLDEKEKSGLRVFRILPLDDTGRWYDVVKFHSLKLGKRYVKLLDPAQDGEISPLNEIYTKMIKSDDPEQRKLASPYRSRDFYIVRGIERGKEDEGIKFFRFPKVGDGSGVMDKIQPLMKYMNDKNPGSGAFFNPINGSDLVINIIRDEVKKYTKVSQIIFDQNSPLSNDQDQMMGWLNDEMTWRDVFRKKPIEFLDIVAAGFEPVWDSEAKKFVGKNDDYTYQPQQTTYTATAEPQVTAPVELGETISIPTGDLPF